MRWYALFRDHYLTRVYSLEDVQYLEKEVLYHQNQCLKATKSTKWVIYSLIVILFNQSDFPDVYNFVLSGLVIKAVYL